MMMLGVNLAKLCLVVDNARSPTDPVSFRNKQSRSGGSSSISAKSRWSSIQPCADTGNKDGSTNLQDTNCSISMVGLRGGSPIRRNRVLVRQLNSTKSRWSSIPLPLCVDETEKKDDSATLQDTNSSSSTAELLSIPLRRTNDETSSSDVALKRIPIRQLSRDRIPKQTGKSPTRSPATKRKEKIKLSISGAPLRVPVRHASPVHATTSLKMTKSDIKSMTSNTGSRPHRIPIRRRSSSGEHIVLSRDLAKLEKLTTALLIDRALKVVDKDA
jgi:hypothetical protein